jgi:hypothetical protein
MMANVTDEMTARMKEALNGMMLDMRLLSLVRTTQTVAAGSNKVLRS